MFYLEMSCFNIKRFNGIKKVAEKLAWHPKNAYLCHR